MSILDQLASDFSLPNAKKGVEYLPFDSVFGTFDFHSARSHFALLISQHSHQSNMGDLERQLHSRERALVGVTDEKLEENSREEDGHQSAESSTPSTTLESEQRCFESEDNTFWDVFNSVSVALFDISSNSEESFLNFVSKLDH